MPWHGQYASAFSLSSWFQLLAALVACCMCLLLDLLTLVRVCQGRLHVSHLSHDGSDHCVVLIQGSFCLGRTSLDRVFPLDAVEGPLEMWVMVDETFDLCVQRCAIVSLCGCNGPTQAAEDLGCLCFDHGRHHVSHASTSPSGVSHAEKLCDRCLHGRLHPVGFGHNLEFRGRSDDNSKGKRATHNEFHGRNHGEPPC